MKTVSKKLLSLMLVALLLVSAIPFQAFADAHVAEDPSHQGVEWVNTDPAKHWKVCTKVDCDNHTTALPGTENPHTFTNGVCVCGYVCPHTSTSSVGAVAATCNTPGKEADTVCQACGLKIATGAATPATGVHTFGADNVCTVCSFQKVGEQYTLTLECNNGHIGNTVSASVLVREGNPIGELPTPTRDGYSFLGWFIGSDEVRQGKTYGYSSNQTAIAKWSEKTELLTVRRVLNGDYSTAKTIYTENVAINTPLWSFLQANVFSKVTAELNLTPGFYWENNFWYDYSGTQSQIGQGDCMNKAQTIYVNFRSSSYTLYFDANGGTVTPASKTVYFGSKVGALPTPSKSGSVFQGWKDANGTLYTAETVYKVAGNTNLTAVWQDEALVLLYVHVNGNFSAPDRVIVMDGYVQNNNISRDAVFNKIAGIYKPTSGSLSVAGLFNEASWNSYKSSPSSVGGVPNLAVENTHTNKIYVMITNAAGANITSGSTTNTVVSNPTTNTNTNNNTNPGVIVNQNQYGDGYSYNAPSNGTTVIPNNNTVAGTNPKTGDTAMIEAAAAVMVLAAAALVTVFTMRKKKMF